LPNQRRTERWKRSARTELAEHMLGHYNGLIMALMLLASVVEARLATPF